MDRITLTLLLFLSVFTIGFSQEKEPKKASIPIETMFGNRKINYLAIFNFKLDSSEKFGYFGVMTVNTPYDENNGKNEFIISNAMTYKLTDKVFAAVGLQYHFLKGVIPYSGLQFLNANSNWLLVISPTLAFGSKPSIQNIAIVEYKPKLSTKLKLYTRFQAIYNVGLKNRLHERSLLYLRTGVSLNKLSLGFGFNTDFYGNQRMRQENFGLFIHHLF